MRDQVGSRARRDNARSQAVSRNRKVHTPYRPADLRWYLARAVQAHTSRARFPGWHFSAATDPADLALAEIVAFYGTAADLMRAGPWRVPADADEDAVKAAIFAGIVAVVGEASARAGFRWREDGPPSVGP